MYIVISAILILPWLIIPVNDLPDPTRLIKSVFFDSAMMGIIVYTLINGLKFRYQNKYLGWFSGWVFLTICMNWYYPIVRGIGYNITTIDGSIHYILALIATVFVCSNFDKEDFIKISKAIWFSSTLVTGFSLLQIIGLDPLAHVMKYEGKESRHISALLDHPDLVGNYLTICFPFLLYLNGWKYFITLILSGVVILCTKSSLSIVALFLSSLVFLYLKYQKIKYTKYLSALAISIGIIFCFYNQSFLKLSNGFTGRIYAWENIIHKLNNPAFGQGIGVVKSLEVRSGAYKENLWIYAHNDYLEIFSALGAVGLILFILIFLNSLKNFSYKPENTLGFSFLASLIAFMIISFGSFPMEIAPLALGGLTAWWGVEKL